MEKNQLITHLIDHMIPEMRSVVSDYSLRDSKPSYHMVDYKEGGSLTILCICRHCLIPFCEVINDYDHVTMPLG